MQGTVAITGGAAGLGAVIADTVMATRRGVILVDRDEATASATANRLRARHAASVAIIAADLATLDGIAAAADALDGHADLTALVNNAGSWSTDVQYPEVVPDEWLATLTLDLIAPMLLTQRLWARLAAARGAVVQVGSSAGEGTEAYGSPEYAAAKAGLRRFTSALGDRSDVRVMAVVPGWIGLDRAHRQLAALTPEEQRTAGPLIPPETVAEQVLRLVERGCAGEIVELLG